jgi:iduronate 2-sulfatase
LSLAAAGLPIAITIASAGSAPTPHPNVLFIAIDDLPNELGCLGASHARTPQLDAFAATARVFDNHHVQVPTCGASRCALMTGLYPRRPIHINNNAMLATHAEYGARTLPAWMRANGYQTLALGKITHHPGGLTGREWAEGPEEMPGVWDRCWLPETPWKTPEAIMHGFAGGQRRVPGKSAPLESFDGSDSAYPDWWIANEAIATLQNLRNNNAAASKNKPWFFAVGFFKPHLPFAAPKRWFDLHASQQIPPPLATTRPPAPSGWHRSAEFFGNYKDAQNRNPNRNPAYALEIRRAHAAATSYVDAQVGRLLDELKKLGLERDTIVIIWGDNGFLLGEHAIWGKHTLYENAVRTPLMIRVPAQARPGVKSSATVETVDLFPTLADLCGLPAPDGVDGCSIRAHIENPAAPSSKPALSFWGSGQRAIRTDRWRLITHPGKAPTLDESVELFDMINMPGETQNVALNEPAVVKELLARLALVPGPASSPPPPTSKAKGAP